jgi:hypothetical protein
MSYGNTANINLGACEVYWGATVDDTTSLGYTDAATEISFETETQDVEVQQEDAPVDVLITSQKVSVKVPMKELDIDRMASLLPGASVITDAVDPTSKRLVVTGAAGGTLASSAKKLTIVPKSGNALFTVVITAAVPKPSLNFKFGKGEASVFEVTFEALATGDGSSLFEIGDPDAEAA